MGFALAEAFYLQGADVTVISGPTSQKIAYSGIKNVSVVSAEEMYNACIKEFKKTDIAVMSAAVADYAPKIVAKEKIKKSEEEFTIELVKNPDILKTMGEKKSHQFLVGFALETQNEEENAKGKLEKKNLDMIVLNSLKDEGAGFQKDTNKIKILTKTEQKEFSLKSKEDVAKDILNL
mgnify:CR=1 FL=1